MSTEKHLKSIQAKNFRSFDGITVEDFGQINVIIGKNNSGKTALLEAIMLSLMSDHVEILFNLNQTREINDRSVERIKLLFHNLDLSRNILLKAFFSDREEHEISIEPKSNPTIQLEKSSKDSKTIDSYAFSLNQNNINSIDIRTKRIRTKEDTLISLTFHSSGEVMAVRSGNSSEHRLIIYVSPTTITGTTQQLVKKIVIDKRESAIVNVLQQIDSRITNINLIDNEIYFNVAGVDSLMPIQLMGDGIGKILSCIAPLAVANELTAIFIDEIENGLHYSSNKKLWASLLKGAQESGTQLFITTHSIEALQYLQDVLAEQPDMQPKLSVFDLVKTKKAGYKAYRYTYDSLSSAIELGNEIRL